MGKRKRQRTSRTNLSRDACEVIEAEAQRCFLERDYLKGLKKLDQVLTGGRPTLSTWKLAAEGLIALEEFAQAIPLLEKANAIDPEDTEVCFNLAGANYQLGRVDEAVDGFRKLANQGHQNALCNLATIIPGSPAATQDDILSARIAFGDSLKDGEREHTESSPSFSIRDRIRVGYVSGYFHRENYMKPVASLIREHDRGRFEIRLFADNAGASKIDWFQAEDDAQIIETTRMSNDELVNCIRTSELDVVVDLNAYSVPERLPIYAKRLARVGIAWFNMYATSGLPGIDAIVGDPWVVEENEERYYSEQVKRLPLSYLTFGVHYEAPPVQEPPCLENGYVTFGSLVSQYKLTPEMWDVWSAILKQVPGARLALGNRATKSTENREFILRELQRRGVEAERVQFLPPAEHTRFLEHYNSIDIALDAFPYNGGTTTTEAIWQGVPVIAANGDRWASRTSRTLLANAGLQECLAANHEDYVDTAVRFASRKDLPRYLRDLRYGLRDRLKVSPVCDVSRLAREFEQVLIRCLQEKTSS